MSKETTTTYITFGQQYGLPGNPWGKDCHPSGYPVSSDGWCEITGCTEEHARGIAFALFGQNWAFLYGADDMFDPEDKIMMYEAGCQLRVTVEVVS